MDPFDLQRDRENSYGPFATNILLIRVDVMPQVPDRPLRQLVFLSSSSFIFLIDKKKLHDCYVS